MDLKAGLVTMRQADYEGWLVPSERNTWRPRRVRIWTAEEEPVALEEWHRHVLIEQLEGYDPPRAIVGGSPLQATMLAFVALHLVAREQNGYVASEFREDEVD